MFFTIYAFCPFDFIVILLPILLCIDSLAGHDSTLEILDNFSSSFLLETTVVCCQLITLYG